MKPKKRQKLCQNCEGEVDLDVIVCPLCAADLREEKPEQSHSPYIPAPSRLLENPQQTAQSLYPPPYSSREEAPVAAKPTPDTSLIWPTFLFALGVQLFVIALLTFFFSHQGVVLLQWDARFWFLYAFASVPFLVFGYKALSKLKD